MKDRYHPTEPEQWNQTQLNEHRLEIENRIKNLFWTVSGDYTLNIRPDVEAFSQSKYMALYDAIKQGAFAHYFDSQSLAMYIMKKVYLSAQEKPLLELVQLCVDAAVYPIIKKERKGIDDIRKQAFTDALKNLNAVDKQKFISQTDITDNSEKQNFFIQVKTLIMEQYLGLEPTSVSSQVSQTVQKIIALGKLEQLNTDIIIQTIDEIYNSVFDVQFETQHGNLKQVMNVTKSTLSRSLQKEFMTDEEMDNAIQKILSGLQSDMLRLDIAEQPKERHFFSHKKKDLAQIASVVEDKTAAKRIYDYVKLNFGISYLSELEQQRYNDRLCRGIHKGSALYFTEGILHAPVAKNNPYRFNQLQFEKNRMYYYGNHRVIKRNIAVLADTLKKVLIMRSEDSICRSRSGRLIPSRLWKPGRTNDPKLFDKNLKADNSDFVVDILLDSSGSQAKRQSQVAAQGYIISQALSAVGIAHRVVSFCTFWDHTVMHRFRNYDDDKEQNTRIFEFYASANNRDGLAIKATYDNLIERQEEHKILIILSDGRPSDMGRGTNSSAYPYQGEEAVKDTAFEVRRARAMGIAVLGIFAGKYDDLAAEKKIYGKDFAYIRNINNFSQIVGTYLRKQLDIE